MKFTVLIVTLLGIFLAPVLARNEKHKEKNEGYPHQSLITDKKNLVAHIDTNNGFNSWSSVWDYTTGFAATRFFSKKTCIISKINTNILPFIVLAPPSLSGEQAQLPPASEHNLIVSRKRAGNLAKYGKPIQALCRGIPTYLAFPAPSSNFLQQGVPCLKTQQNKVIINYCNYPK